MCYARCWHHWKACPRKWDCSRWKLVFHGEETKICLLQCQYSDCATTFSGNKVSCMFVCGVSLQQYTNSTADELWFASLLYLSGMSVRINCVACIANDHEFAMRLIRRINFNEQSNIIKTRKFLYNQSQCDMLIEVSHIHQAILKNYCKYYFEIYTMLTALQFLQCLPMIFIEK